MACVWIYCPHGLHKCDLRASLHETGGSAVRLLASTDFANQANTTYELWLGASAMNLTLIDIRPLAAMAYPGMTRQPFSLIFRSGVQNVLPQRIYQLKNAASGMQDVFLAPIGRDASGVIYEAVFN
jgi:hypothetical protein